MTKPRWEEVEKLFAEALACAPADRASFIERSCAGNGDLLAEVESLLAAHHDAEDFLETPAAGQFADSLADSSGKLTPGSSVRHYRIIKELGKGGQGTVYQARDSKLDRLVALKVLPPQFLADETGVKRFQREARLASSLDHANICTVHDLVEIDGTHIIVMQFVEGQNVRQLVNGQPLELGSALKIAIQVCDALAAAHHAKIIHRDIKAHNVIVTSRGQVKVLDFGLAKIAGENAGEQTELTAPGQAYGTPTYAAPEQSRGEVVDHRADIFSTGVLLYEMLTGTGAFPGKTAVDVRHAVLHDDPRPAGELRGTAIPARLEAVLARSLAKEPSKRYRQISEMRDELVEILETLSDGETERSPRLLQEFTPRRMQRWSRAAKAAIALALVVILVLGSITVYRYFSAKPKGKTIDSIAVLPFLNETQDPNAEYLSDGISETLINDLSKLPALKVSPRNTVFRFKGRTTEAQKVGSELGVGAVLTGSLKQVGDRLAINVELVDVTENRQLWGQQYVRKFSDVFELQRDITREVLAQLRLTLSGADQQLIASHQTTNPEAYRLYLQGRYQAVKMTRESFTKGMGYLEQAIALDPNYALAYSGLAFYYVQSLDQILPPSEAMPKSRQAAQKAIELDPTLSEAHISLAFVYWQYDWNWEQAEREFKQALELAPNNSENRAAYGFFLVLMGRSDAGLNEINEASRLNPLSIETGLYVSPGYYFARKYEQSLKKAQQASETAPDFWLLQLIAGRCLEQQGDLKGATEKYLQAQKIDQNSSEILMDLGRAYGRSGQRADAERVLAVMKGRETTGYVSPFQTAMVYIGLGDRAKALEALEQAYQARTWYMSWLKTAPELDPLRDDPRFAALLQRMNFPA
jgi:serine/threonine-protein kinase